MRSAALIGTGFAIVLADAVIAPGAGDFLKSMLPLIGAALVGVGGWHLAKTISHGSRLAKLEAEMSANREDIKEIKADLKFIRRRME